MKQNDMEKQLDQLLANLPKQQYDTDQWLVEDHTAEFDRIVGQRRRKAWRWRLAAIAAVAVGLIFMVGVMLEKETEIPQVQIAQQSPTTAPVIPPTPVEPTTPTLAQATPQKPVKVKQVKPVSVSHATMTPIDSLTDIIAHIESSMQGVRDSCYMANVEKLIRVDDRLQRLVNDLILEGMMNTPTAQVALNEPQDNND